MGNENHVVGMSNDQISLLVTGIVEIAQMLDLLKGNQPLSGPEVLLLIDGIKDSIGRKGNLELLPVDSDGTMEHHSLLEGFPVGVVLPPDTQTAARRVYTHEASSARIWYPALQAAGGFRMPRTEFVDFDPMSLYPVLEGKEPGVFPWVKMVEACATVGFPAFIRTDLASAHRSGPAAYRITDPRALEAGVNLTFEHNALKDLASNVSSFMVREFITFAGPFVAFGGLPITREWRIFIVDDAVSCAHFYWPEEAFNFHTETLPQTWQQDLAELSKPPADLEELESIALRAARAVGEGNWSVDFGQDVEGIWWLIDMGRAERSWHPKHVVTS